MILRRSWTLWGYQRSSIFTSMCGPHVGEAHGNVNPVCVAAFSFRRDTRLWLKPILVTHVCQARAGNFGSLARTTHFHFSPESLHAALSP